LSGVHAGFSQSLTMLEFNAASWSEKPRQRFIDRELTLGEMLADPIVQLVMRRDRVKPETIMSPFGPRQDRHAA
jgi:hypothetical protein